MSRASNTLTTSDVITTPIKLKYSSSYDNTSYYDAGIRVLGGVNGAVTSTGSVPQKTLNYISVRHLFYSNYLTGSFPVSASSAYNWEQSTAAAGTGDADVRIFPTGSNAKIKILSLPRQLTGEKLSRGSFQLVARDGVSFDIRDDGNGNLIDYASNQLFVIEDYIDADETFTDGYTYGPSIGAHVGNILYAQGIIIITNELYYDLLDAGPLVYDHIYTFYDYENPKQFDPINDAPAAEPDSSPINTATLQLIPITGASFPAYTIVNSTLVNLSNPTTIPIGNYTIDYNIESLAGIPSNTANIEVRVLPGCDIQASYVDYYYSLGSPRLLYDFTDRSSYGFVSPTQLVGDLSGNGNAGVFVDATDTVIAYEPFYDYQPYVANPPLPLGYMDLARASMDNSIVLPDEFAFSATNAFSFVTWLKIGNWMDNLSGFSWEFWPGIISATGYDVSNYRTGWYWTMDSTGIQAGRVNESVSTVNAVSIPWTSMNLLPGTQPPYGGYLYLFITYDGASLRIGGISTVDNQIKSNSIPSTVSLNPLSGWTPRIGMNGDYTYGKNYYGYVAGYDTALGNSELEIIYTATKGKYGY